MKRKTVKFESSVKRSHCGRDLGPSDGNALAGVGVQGVIHEWLKKASGVFFKSN